MRKHGIEKPYEKLKELTRGNEGINQQIINDFVDSLNLPEEDKKVLLNLKPSNYIGKII